MSQLFEVFLLNHGEFVIYVTKVLKSPTFLETTWKLNISIHAPSVIKDSP